MRWKWRAARRDRRVCDSIGAAAARPGGEPCPRAGFVTGASAAQLGELWRGRCLAGRPSKTGGALLTDPQTSGGLLIACDAHPRRPSALAFEKAIRARDRRLGRARRSDRRRRRLSAPWRETGGREWESNPPETGSLPHSDLKSGRPTGDDSPPSARTGFGRSEQIQAMRVDPAQVALAQGHAMAVEEVEDLDRHLAAVVDPIAELRGGESAVVAPPDPQRSSSSPAPSTAERNGRAPLRRPAHAAYALEDAAQIVSARPVARRGRALLADGIAAPRREAARPFPRRLCPRATAAPHATEV